MTSPQQQPTAPSAPAHKDWAHRSTMGIGGGLLLCAIIGWLGIDALVHGDGRTPWLALAGMLLVLPIVIAFTLRPAVFVNEQRLRVRNPFRVITLPWGKVSGLRSGYSNEVFSDAGTKYQLWAIPVSLRARKRANRQQARLQMEAAGITSRPGGFASAFTAPRPGDSDEPTRAATDKIMDDLRELHEGHAAVAQGEVTIRWAYEILAPALVGAIALAVLLATG
ncbi:PH domain-containing protein [Streptomyces sp. SID4985]|uniref:PH domain-containing protein n=1 Tax=unclassified Streptomyces TaxID=2593676 RepID=UPI00136A2483|nr:PH domain-containing protein [Streptomyces sp. SID4985]MYQ47354.1 PH domain-containing protein [Streptomyces sp. SID4985]